MAPRVSRIRESVFERRRGQQDPRPGEREANISWEERNVSQIEFAIPRATRGRRREREGGQSERS